MASIQDIDYKKITNEEFKILKEVVKDPFEFAKHIFVINSMLGKVPFHLYPYQTKLLWCFLVERFNIILKFRQAGVTELISLYCLWLAMYHDNKTIQIISIKDRVAKKVLRKIKFMYRNLPTYLQVPIVNGRPKELGTAEEMEFINGSTITSLPTTEDSGRSESLTLLVIDEAAIVRWANTIWASAFPTLSTGGHAIINSTPYGVGNWYHKTWTAALSGANGFNPVRLKWEMHPDRDINWYNEMRAVLGERRTAQEIDGDFLTSGNTVFDLMSIRAIEDSIIDFPVLERKFNGNLIINEHPIPGRHYFIGADVATGRSKDFSAFTIMDKYGNEAGYFKGKMSVGKFADVLMEYGKRYNRATIAPETNDIGLSVTTKIQESGYRNLYYWVKLLKEKGESKPKEEKVPGWLTTKKNRPIIIDELESDIRNDIVTIKDPFFVTEAYTFIYDNNNRPVAMGKEGSASEEEFADDSSYTDDAVMAKSITNFIRKGKINTAVVSPR